MSRTKPLGIPSMGRTKPSSYTDDQVVAAILRSYVVGMQATCDETGIGMDTLGNWRQGINRRHCFDRAARDMTQPRSDGRC